MNVRLISPHGHARAENHKNQAVFVCAVRGCEADAEVSTANTILAAGLGPLCGVAGLGGTRHAMPEKAERPCGKSPPGKDRGGMGRQPDTEIPIYEVGEDVNG